MDADRRGLSECWDECRLRLKIVIIDKHLKPKKEGIAKRNDKRERKNARVRVGGQITIAI